MPRSNERLAIVCPMCLHEFPDHTEGELTPRHPGRDLKECKGTGKELETIVTIRFVQIYNN